MEKLLEEKQCELYALEYSGRDDNAVHLGKKAKLRREIAELEKKLEAQGK